MFNLLPARPISWTGAVQYVPNCQLGTYLEKIGKDKHTIMDFKLVL
jgi:hypothetical protein